MEDSVDSNKEQQNHPICDKIFAQLTDMFGDMVPSEIILKTGQENKWQLNHCIEQLIKYSESISTMNTNQVSTNQNLNSNCNDDDDLDAFVLIDSDELQSSQSTNDMQRHTGAIKKTNVRSNQLLDAKEVHASNNCPSETQHQSTSNKLNIATPFASLLKQPHSETPFKSNDFTPVSYKQMRTSSVIKEHPKLKEIVCDINKCYRVMICMRGVPGSGKSYLARTIIDRTMNGDYENHIFSTDDFFYDRRTKQYNYNRQMLGQAHESNQFRVAQRTMNGWSPIIIDNTNVKLWEMFPYIQHGVRNGYIIKVIEPNTPWARSIGPLCIKNKHKVNRETIGRMLTNYEKGTVRDVLRLMQIHDGDIHPRLRNFPTIENRMVHDDTTDRDKLKNKKLNFQLESSESALMAPKEQRTRKIPNTISESAVSTKATNEMDTFQMAVTKLENLNDEWPAFEEEQNRFWNSDAEMASPQPKKNSDRFPKPQRSATAPDTININSMCNLLRDTPNTSTKNVNNNDATVLLRKHEKECSNENKSFQQIRHIYPNIPISFLWDLFEKCNGDGDWVMDILLNEDPTRNITKLENDEEILLDNFVCDCSTPNTSKLQQAANAIPAELLQETRAPSPLTHSRSQSNRLFRRPQKDRTINENEVRKQIEGLFVIPDNNNKHHSKSNLPVKSMNQTVSDEAIGKESNTDDAIIEMDLGISLICQLDSVFGVKAFQRENLKDMKTTVFLPRSLGQQLYAIWMESLYNQLEEQRQQSVKDDAEFAKEFQIKQNYAPIFPEVTNINVKDILDMECTWKAYKADINEWKQTTPEDLATKLTKAKLFEIFPNVDKEILIEVFAAHGNKFAETVETLKGSLQFGIDEKNRVESQQLINEAQMEAQTIRPNPPPPPSVSMMNKYNEMQLNKLDMEEAKRAALEDFEVNRNMAMHHSHLKAECYTKAKEAFQRRQQAVAHYYSNVANLHNTKIDWYNNKAANAIVEVHSYTQQNPDMLDLHYLHAGEAIECLDIFLDKHLKELKDLMKGYKYVFIITGRGLHSTGGFSTIKHRVKNRFRERNLSWAEVNPGLLKVKLQFISEFAQEINKN